MNCWTHIPGFCWTKIWRHTRCRPGKIYVGKQRWVKDTGCPTRHGSVFFRAIEKRLFQVFVMVGVSKQAVGFLQDKRPRRPIFCTFGPVLRPFSLPSVALGPFSVPLSGTHWALTENCSSSAFCNSPTTSIENRIPVKNLPARIFFSETETLGFN